MGACCPKLNPHNGNKGEKQLPQKSMKHITMAKTAKPVVSLEVEDTYHIRLRQLPKAETIQPSDSKYEVHIQKPKSLGDQLTFPSSNEPNDIACQSSAASTNQGQTPQSHFTWEKGQELGKGAYGQVYQGLNTQTGEIIAIKYIKVRQLILDSEQLSGDKTRIEREIENLKGEISILKALDHKNIVKYLQTDICPDKSGVYILLEYLPGGSLLSMLERFKKFEENLVRIYLRQILSGLAYLHANQVIHRDLKCANILVSSDGQIKLSDFGASKRLNYSHDQSEGMELCNSLKGSPYWIAPEVLKGQGYSYSADIWSLGCLLIEMLTGRPPWTEYGSDPTTILRVIKGTQTPPKIPSSISKEAQSFLEVCLRIDPSQRPTSLMLFEHPFIKNNTNPSVKESQKANIVVNIEEVLQQQAKQNLWKLTDVSQSFIEHTKSMISSVVDDSFACPSFSQVFSKNMDPEQRKIAERKALEKWLEEKAMTAQNRI